MALSFTVSINGTQSFARGASTITIRIRIFNIDNWDQGCDWKSIFDGRMLNEKIKEDCLNELKVVFVSARNVETSNL